VSNDIPSVPEYAPLIRFEYRNLQKVGLVSHPTIGTRTTYTIDHELEERPTAKDFDRISTIEAQLATMFIDTASSAKLIEQRDAVLEAIRDLRDAMMAERAIPEDDRADLFMGDLDALPEVVETRNELVAFGREKHV